MKNNTDIIKRTLICAVLCTAFLLAVNAQDDTYEFISPDNENIEYMGRISRAGSGNIRFTYPGVSIFANFEGTSIRMKTNCNSGYFMVEIDGAKAFKVKSGVTDSIVTLAEGLTYGEHEARIMYAVEGYELRPEFRGFYVDKGCHLAQAPVLPERKIEFIGNSMTCGYGIESDNPKDPFTYATENHYYTYAAETARRLHAQHLVVARSGIGIYRNYGAPKEGSKDCMPAMYEQTLFNDSTQLWDHSLYIPDVVCVNLGTNDVSLNNYDTRLLTDAYRRFVRHLRDIYPNAKIVLLTGSMLSGKPLKDVKEALDTVQRECLRNGDTQIYRFDMSPQTGSLGMGANYHPSKRQHQKMASELTEYLREITKW